MPAYSSINMCAAGEQASASQPEPTGAEPDEGADVMESVPSLQSCFPSFGQTPQPPWCNQSLNALRWLAVLYPLVYLAALALSTSLSCFSTQSLPVPCIERLEPQAMHAPLSIITCPKLAMATYSGLHRWGFVCLLKQTSLLNIAPILVN